MTVAVANNSRAPNQMHINTSHMGINANFFGFVLCAWFFVCLFIVSLRLVTVLLNFRTLDVKWIWCFVFIFECQLPAFVRFSLKKVW